MGRTAAAACERLTVVVAGSPQETIPIVLRAAWLRERHDRPHVEVVAAVDDTEVDFESDAVWETHVGVFRAALAALSGTGPGATGRPPVDAVFSSEEYGPELARRMSAAHVPVDPARARFPVSGRARTSSAWTPPSRRSTPSSARAGPSPTPCDLVQQLG